MTNSELIKEMAKQAQRQIERECVRLHEDDYRSSYDDEKAEEIIEAFMLRLVVDLRRD